MLNPKERAKSKTGDDEYIVNLYVLLTNDKMCIRDRDQTLLVIRHIHHVKILPQDLSGCPHRCV